MRKSVRRNVSPVIFPPDRGPIQGTRAPIGHFIGVDTARLEDPAAFYPAPGSRASGSGALWSVGSYGYSWTSFTSDSYYGYHLDFRYTRIYPSTTTYRANGFQLRCLQE